MIPTFNESADIKALIDGGRKQTVVWSDAALGPRQATIPLVVFTR